LDKLNIGWASYEHRTRKGARVANGKADAFYGKVVIEYESPKTFGDRPNVKNKGYQHAINQLTNDYIPGLAKHPRDYHRYFGITIDGFQIGFVRHRDQKWIDEGPYLINGNTYENARSYQRTKRNL
jgi:hypothetical protein